MRLSALAIFFLLITVLSAATVETAAQSTLTVLTYNINHGKTTKGYSNLLRVSQLIRQYKPDLVALQEVDSVTKKSFQRDQLDQLAKLTGMQPLYGKASRRDRGSVGVAILSRYPFIAYDNLMLPNPDSTEQRTLLCGYVERTDGQTFRFCTTHLDGGSVVNRGFQLAMCNLTMQKSIQPVIWTGVLNTDPEDLMIQKLNDTWTDAGRDSQTPTLVGSGARVDYVLTQRESNLELVRYRVLNEPATSTHRPLLVTYRLKNAAPEKSATANK